MEDNSILSNFPDPRMNILFPVLNEQDRLESGIRHCVDVLDEICPNNYILTIVDNGSSDSTEVIASNLVKESSAINYIKANGKGVGLAFREGVKHNACPIVGYMDIDLATSPLYVSDVLNLMDQGYELVNAVRWKFSSSQKGRPAIRRATSAGLIWILRSYLGMQASDAVCGFKFFKKEIADALVDFVPSDLNDWSYIIELLLDAERSGVKIAELPVDWKDDGKSGVRVLSQIYRYLKDFQIIRKRLV